LIRCRCIFLFGILLAGCLLLPYGRGLERTPSGKAAHTPLTLDQVVDRLIAENIKRSDALQGYQSRRTYTVAYKGFWGDLHAQMVVDLDYTAPDTKKFTIVSESGPRLLVDHILKELVTVETESQVWKNRKSLLPNRQNYNFTHMVYQPASDGCSYILSVDPVVPNKLLYRGRIWVNDRDFAICRIEGYPSRTPSLWITDGHLIHTYSKIGEFWFSKEDKSVSSIRLGGTATLTIEYGDYKIRSAPLRHRETLFRP
jgi:hypothetical protein